MSFLYLVILGFILTTTSFQTIGLSENTGIDELINNTIEFEPKNECNVCVIHDSPDFFDWVEFISNVFGIFVGGLGVYGFYIAKKRGLRNRIFNSIILELKDNLSRNPIIDAKRLRARSFFTFAFESAVNSGDFSHFKDTTQAKLSGLYQEMKMYNQYLNNVNLAYEMSQMQNQDTPYDLLGYEQLINSLRKKVLKEIPEIITIIEKEVPKNFIIK